MSDNCACFNRMTNMSDERLAAQEAAWAEHNLSQLRYFRSLSLRARLEAVAGMADVIRHFEGMRARGGFQKSPPSRTTPSDQR